MPRPEKTRGCKFCKDNGPTIDYKDVAMLQKCCSPQGKLYDRSRVGTCAKHQRRIAKAVKRARFLALLRYTGR